MRMLRHGRLIQRRLVERLTDVDHKSRYRLLAWARAIERWLRAVSREEPSYIRAAIVGQDLAQLAGVLDMLRRRGWATHEGLAFHHDPAPKYAWLPVEFVTGLGGTSPLSRIRDNGDASALRLAVDLYHEQLLPEYCAVPFEIMRKVHDRSAYGDFGAYRLWGFTCRGQVLSNQGNRAIINQVGRAKAGETQSEARARFDPLFKRLGASADLRLAGMAGLYCIVRCDERRRSTVSDLLGTWRYEGGRGRPHCASRLRFSRSRDQPSLGYVHC